MGLDISEGLRSAGAIVTSAFSCVRSESLGPGRTVELTSSALVEGEGKDIKYSMLKASSRAEIAWGTSLWSVHSGTLVEQAVGGKRWRLKISTAKWMCERCP